MKEDKIKDELEKIDLKLTEEDIESGVTKLKVLQGKKGADVSSYKIDATEFNPPSYDRNKGKYKIKDLTRVFEVIIEENGIKNRICKRLGITMVTFNKMLARHDKLNEAFEIAKNKILDIAESSLIEKVLAKDVQATIFLLRTVGRKRGYREDIEVVPPEKPVFIMKKKERDNIENK